MNLASVEYGGITDYATARAIANNLFRTYCATDSMDNNGMARMLADTYKLMNKQFVPTSNDVSLYSSVLDKDCNGRVTLQDLENLAIKYLVGDKPVIKKVYTPTVKKRLEVAKRLFEKFDTDKSGYLSENQIPNLLIQTYKLMGVDYHPSKEDIKSWMRMTDSDGDGKVTLEDYQKLIIKSLERCGIKIFE